jgi:putative restriction endonuclease
MRDGTGGFLPDVYRLLEKHPEVLKDAASNILKANFPDSLHDEILGAVGLSLEETKSKRRIRDPDFRTLVVRAYQYWA